MIGISQEIAEKSFLGFLKILAYDSRQQHVHFHAKYTLYTQHINALNAEGKNN